MIIKTVNSKKKSINPLYLLIITIIFVELFIGGGGGVFALHIGSIRITVRMILFAFMLLTYYLEIVISRDKILLIDGPGKYVLILLAYCVFSFLVGILFGNSIPATIGDLLPILYLLAYLPITNIGARNDISSEYILKLLYISSSIVSVFSLLMFGLSNFNLISSYELRIFLANYIPDFGIRPNNGFVYSGQFYVLIANLILLSKLLLSKTNFTEKLLIVLYSSTILQASTRGPIYVLVISLIFLIFKSLVSRGGRIRFTGILVFFVILMVLFMFSNKLDLDRIYSFNDVSTRTRTVFIDEVFNIVIKSPLIGVGYGYRLQSKGTAHLEISLLEILLEQGLIGVFLWIMFPISTIYSWKNVKIFNEDKRYLSVAIPLVVFSVVLLSFTNPYLNNSVGISCISIAMLILRIETRNRREYRK